MSKKEEKNRMPKKQDENSRDLPGYPHYPPDEDIMNPQTGFKKISADEELANSKNLSRQSIKDRHDNDNERLQNEEDDLKIVRGTDADVTKEDLELLGSREGDPDQGDDEMMQANSRVDDVPEEGDLDVPGSDLDDESEELGEEDEENNYYSLGGDRHENLEEDQS
ncbi:MAG: hypothetical protein JNK79_15085 [Chitinophagaceae bacterium]|nr:hypothetical protein [Chitinophagaceae bacterium]